MINGKRLLNINEEMLQVYKFIKSEIPTSETNGTGKYLHKTDDLTPYTTELINTQLSAYNKTICDREFCCEFRLRISFNKNIIADTSNYYRYISLCSFTEQAFYFRIVHFTPSVLSWIERKFDKYVFIQQK